MINMALTTSLIFVTAVSCSYGMFLDDNPCDLMPIYGGDIPDNKDFVSNVNVPSQCVNGTFRWDYPRGHTILHFQNTDGAARKVCFGGGLIGNAFTLVDMTDETPFTLPERKGDFDETWSCTHTSKAEEILVRVDAPEMLLYAAMVEYRVE